MAGKTVREEYLETLRAARALLPTIANGLKDHAKQAAKLGTTDVDVADLAFVRERLHEVASFLTDGEV